MEEKLGKDKIVAVTQNDDWVEKKPRKRKVMSDEQKVACAERLAKARAAKAPAKNTSIHWTVLEKDDEDTLSAKNVQEWIKHNKDLLREARGAVRLNQKGAIATAASIEGYIRNMRYYLKHGDWCDNFFGKEGQNKVKWVSVTHGQG